MESKLPEGCCTGHLPETGTFFSDLVRRPRPEQQVASQEVDTLAAFGLRLGDVGTVVLLHDDRGYEAPPSILRHGLDLICEAYVYDKQVRFHMDYATVIRNRSRLDRKRLVVTHMSSQKG